MSKSDEAIREFAEKWGWFVKATSFDMTQFELNKDTEQCLSDLTALIEEHYVSKEDVNQEVERRIAETVAGKFIAVEIEKRIADRQLTDEQIERQFTTSHYHYEKGHYYKVRKDRIFGAKWYRDRLVTQKTEGGGE